MPHARRNGARLCAGHARALADRQAREAYGSAATAGLFNIETRFRYNPDVKSLPAMVPAVIPLLLMLIPAMLSALSVVREKELGSIVNLYVTPVTRLEFLLGKQIPYVALAMINFLLLTALAVFLFGVPVKGSFLDPGAAALLYVIGGHRHRAGDVGLRAQPGRRPVRHRSADHPAGGSVLRDDRSGLLPGGCGRRDRADLSDHPLRDDCARHVLERARFHGSPGVLCSPADRRSRAHRARRSPAQEAGATRHAIRDNILHLGIKELRSLVRDPIMLVLIVYAFTFSIYTAATAMPETLHKAPIAIVDEDRSALSNRIIDDFYPPYFLPPALITTAEMDARMDAGLDTFALHIPSGFQRDLLAGHSPVLQLNVDATRMSQGFTGSGYIQAIVSGEVNDFMRGYRAETAPAVDLVLRARFNPELDKSWFGAVMEIISAITMLSIVLTGAALIREREHGTVEHLLVMPVTPFEIMSSKVLAMALVVLAASWFSLTFIVRGLLAVPIEGSVALFFAGATLHLFATTSMGIFLATLARTMPQFGLLLLMFLLPLQVLSGGMTPRESMPDAVQFIMQAAPNTHFVMLSQAILYRGAGLDVVWPQFLSLAAIGAVLFTLALARFRKTLATMA